MVGLRTLAVLSALSAPSEETVSKEMIEESVRAALEYRVAPPLIDRVQADRFRLGELAKRCGLDLACLLPPLESAGVQLAVVAALDLGIDPPLLTMVMIDVDRKEEVARELAELKSRERADLRVALESAAKHLADRTGLVQAGRALFVVDPADAEVLIAGAELHSAELTPKGRVFKLAPGDYHALISRRDFEAKDATFTVTAGKENEIKVVIEPERSIFESPYFWSATLAGVAAATIGAAIILGRGGDACACIDSVSDGCSRSPGCR